MHTFAQSVPESRSSKPNLFSIHLGSGEVNTFQAGTIDLVQEWLQTCNYWAARRSRQPLQGGVGNIEYGWTRAANGGGAIEDLEDRASIKSGRSNLSKLGGSSGGSSYGRRGYAGSGIMDKVHINDWRPPANAVMPSPLEEEAQLESLSGWIRSLREDLEGHKGVEEAMNRMVRLFLLVRLIVALMETVLFWVKEPPQSPTELDYQITIPPSGDQQIYNLHYRFTIRNSPPRQEAR